MTGQLDSGGGGSTTSTDDPWSATTTDTSDSDSTTSTDYEYSPTTSVDTGLTAAAPSGGGDVAHSDPVNPSASSSTTDREAMTAEADQQQERIDRATQDNQPQNTSSRTDSAEGANAAAWVAGAAVLALMVAGGGS